MGDDELTAVFARQLGLVTRTQARDAGLTDRMVHQRVRSGRWVRVGGGVYRVAGVPVTWSHKALAACLVAGPGVAGRPRGGRRWRPFSRPPGLVTGHPLPRCAGRFPGPGAWGA
ncbi:MAG: type IV toxin-antitoxin system AbiEi family antitoxin domain-containing protein [Actinomycetota bacterium]